MDSISYHTKSASFCDDIRYRVYERVIMSKPYPIVEYAHKIGKNTSEFTTKDLDAYMKWWMKQKPRKDLMEGTAAQKAQYKKDVTAMNKFRAAQTSRLSSDQVADIEQADDSIAEEMQEEAAQGKFAADSVVVGEEIVCSMELTALDVKALLFAIARVCEDYEMTGHEFEASLSSLKESLEGV